MQINTYGKIAKSSLLIVGFLFIALYFIPVILGQENLQKDSDLDGIPDNIEISKYATNPNSSDSDNDGVLDSQEIIDGTDPLNAESNYISFTQKASNEIPVFWYIARISGVAAFIMFTLVICMGLLMTSKILLKYRFLPAFGALEIHTFNATYIAFALLIIHIVALMIDKVINIKLFEVFVPFLIKRDLKSSLGYDLTIPSALGVIAFYLSIVLLTTSHLRNKLVSVKTWRLLHYLSFLFYLLFLVHAYISGTDSRELWMQIIYISSVSCVFTLLMLRVFAKKLFLPKPVVKSATVTKPTPETTHTNTQ